ncbi:MAG: hypothetical protein PSY14_11625 [bacterium]|nr:hypothetical protein [bacterium]
MEHKQHKSEFDSKAERPATDAPDAKPKTELKIVYPLNQGMQRQL